MPPEDPRSYYSVAKKLNEDIPNSFYPNQYDNLSNKEAHYETTGPEMWEQTEGKITHYAAGVGTGGSMCGTARYLKEQNPDVITVGIDTYGSVFKKYKETGEFDTNESVKFGNSSNWIHSKIFITDAHVAEKTKAMVYCQCFVYYYYYLELSNLLPNPPVSDMMSQVLLTASMLI